MWDIRPIPTMRYAHFFVCTSTHRAFNAVASTHMLCEHDREQAAGT
jgi:hypothetical protein